MGGVVALMGHPEGDDRRCQALAEFANATGLPAIRHIVQRGRESESAVYTFEFEGGRKVRVGTIKVLWSLSELSKVMAVTMGCPLPSFAPASWYTLRTKLLEHAIEIDETPGEAFCDIVRDWLGKYCENATGERNGAMAAKRPYVEDDEIRIHAVSFARDIRRQFSASVKEKELLGALGDLGFERRTIMYERGSARASASYYCAPIKALDPGDSA